MQLLHTVGLIIILSAFIRSIVNFIDDIKNKNKSYAIEVIIIFGVILYFWMKYYYMTFLAV